MHENSIKWLGAAGVLALATAIVACSKAEAAEKHADETTASVSVTTVAVEERSFPKSLLLTGSLTPNQDSSVASDGAGKVVKIFVERGSIVKKGDLLAKLDARESALAAAEAGASAETARAEARHAKLECERADKLIAAQVISRSEYDKIKSGCDTTTANVGAASARAARASKEVGDSLIRAPFSGVVAERFISVGEYVNAGTKVARIVEVDPMRVELSVPEVATGKLTKGQIVKFSVGPVPNERFDAKIEFIGPALDGKSRNLSVEAVLVKPDARLKPGMFATTALPTGEQKGTGIPESAIAGEASSPRVFVVRDGRVEERVVTIGERDGGMALVTKGLTKGEQVVARPGKDIRDGLKVK